MNGNKKALIFCTVVIFAICGILMFKGLSEDTSDVSSKKAQSDQEVSVITDATKSAAVVVVTPMPVSSPELTPDQIHTKKKEKEIEKATERPPEAKKSGVSEKKKKTKKQTDSGNQVKIIRNDKKQVQKKEKPVVGEVFPTVIPTSVPLPEETTTPAPEKSECGLTITCSAVLSHMDQLTEGVKKVIPADGMIAQGTFSFEEGETVFDLLKKVCKDKSIVLDYTYTPLYSTYYVKGINHLYEFDCGDESGWMYSVNGKEPGYGCSQYKLQKGDQIVFYYTCEY